MTESRAAAPTSAFGHLLSAEHRPASAAGGFRQHGNREARAIASAILQAGAVRRGEKAPQPQQPHGATDARASAVADQIIQAGRKARRGGMIAQKEALVSLRDLRPTDGTSAAIRAAFYRLQDARAANNAEIARLDAARPGMLMTAAPTEIERNDESLRRRRIMAEQLDVLEAELRRSFTTAKEREDDAEFAAKLDELKASEAAWNADVRARYPNLAAQIAELLQRERDLISAYASLQNMPAAERMLVGQGRSPYHLMLSMQKAYSGPRGEPKAFSDLVALPSTIPAEPIWRGNR